MTQSTIWKLLATTALGAALLAQPAFAQTAAPAAAPADDLLGEVVVTATRQSDTVNKVPLSISAVTQKTIEAQGIKTVDDLSRTVPGMTFRRTGGEGNPVVTIRGIGGNGATVGSQTTGVYLDDSALQRRQINGLQTGNGAPFPNLFDLERVEVLRGPQGTLYGDSSEGGTIRFITPTPSLVAYSGQAKLETSFTKSGAASYEGGFALGGPIIQDKLGFRLSLDNRYQGGYVDAKSVFDGHTFGENVNWNNSTSFRGVLKWAVDDSFSITPAIYYGRDHSNSGDGVLGPSDAVSYSGTTIHNGANGCNVTSKASANAGPCALTIAGVQYFGAFPDTVVPAHTQNAMPWYDFTSTGTGYYKTTTDVSFVNSPRTTKLYLPSLTIDKTFGDISVKSVTTYVHDITQGLTFTGGTGGGGRNVSRYMFGTTNCIPGQNLPRASYTAGTTACFTPPTYLPGFPQYIDWYNYRSARNGKSEELRFSTPTNRRLSVVTGGFLSYSRIHMHGLEQNNENAVSVFYRGIPEAWGIGNYPLPFQGVASPTPYTLNTPYLDVSDREVDLTEKTWAVFGEANFNVTDKLKLTAGGRYNDYKQVFKQVYGGAVAGNPPAGTSSFNPAGFVVNPALAQAQSVNPALPNSRTNPITNPAATALFALNVAGCPTAADCPFQYTSLQSHEKTFAPKLGASYQFTSTNMIYATFSKGFRPGGVNPPVPPLQCAVDFTNLNITASPLSYDQDSVSSYEVGNKIRVLGGKVQLNSSAFYIDWKSMQFNQALSCGFAFINNAGHAVSKGAELQANGRFGAWTLGANIGYNKAAFADDVKTATGVLVQNKGDNIGVPDWTVALNAQYDFNVAGLPGFIRADYQYSGQYFRGPGVGTNGFNLATYKGRAYDIVNARASITAKGIDWAVFVQNLTNEAPFISYGGGATAGADSSRFSTNAYRPRVIGVQANYRF